MKKLNSKVLRGSLIGSSVMCALILMSVSIAAPVRAQTTITPTFTGLGTLETAMLTSAFSIQTTQVTVGSPTDYHLRYIEFTPADWSSVLCPGAKNSAPLSDCGITLKKDGNPLADVTLTKNSGTGLIYINFPAANYPAGWSLPAGTVWTFEFVAGAFRTSTAIGAGIILKQGGNVWFPGSSTWGGPVTLDYASRVLLQNHVVTFDANGGTGTMDRQLGRSSAPLTSIGQSITRSGYSFEGWATSQAKADAGTVDYVDGATFPFQTSQGTLYAVWKSNFTGTVTFDANGGAGTMSQQSANGSASLTANTFTKEGHSFAGWNTSANGSGTSYADGATYTFNGSETLYAMWKSNAVAVSGSANKTTSNKTSESLPSTGSDAMTLTAFGLAAIAIGLLGVGVQRRKTVVSAGSRTHHA
jgi:LPXTG-motif cell wall-anchored protein/uncharacterized repeat protein (TIGR02543 family)